MLNTFFRRRRRVALRGPPPSGRSGGRHLGLALTLTPTSLTLTAVNPNGRSPLRRLTPTPLHPRRTAARTEELSSREIVHRQSCGGGGGGWHGGGRGTAGRGTASAVVWLFKNFIKVQTRPLTLTPTPFTLTAFNPNPDSVNFAGG